MKYRHYITELSLLASLLTGCVDDVPAPAPDEGALQEVSVLNVLVAPAGLPTQTRAGDLGDVAALNGGERMHSIKVWAFASPGQKITENGVERNVLSDTSIGYAEFYSNNGTSELQQMQLTLPKYIVDAELNIDLYVSANAQDYLYYNADPTTSHISTPGRLPATSTRWEIEHATLGNYTGVTTDPNRIDPFGLSDPWHAVPAVGLTMSDVKYNLKISGESSIGVIYLEDENGQQTNYIQMELTRVMSKLRFLAAKAPTVVSAQITKVEIGLLDGESNIVGGAFPKRQYEFPNITKDANGVITAVDKKTARLVRNTDEDIYNVGTPTGEYEESPLPLVGDGSAVFEPIEVATSDDPKKYLWENFTGSTAAQDYDDYLTQYIEAGELSATDYVYLRETDKRLYGKIEFTYTIYETDENGNYVYENGERKVSAPITGYKIFRMAAEQDFARNHVWNIYAYLDGTGLYVRPYILPWQHENTLEIETGTRITTEVFGNEYLKYTDSGGKEYIAVGYSSALGTINVETDEPVDFTGGNPRELTINSPLLVLHYSAGRALRMSRFAPHFLFLYAKVSDDDDVEVTEENIPTTGWRVSRNIRMQAKGTGVFYVIPDGQFSEGVEQRENIIVVSETSGSSGLLPGNVNINSENGLPGILTQIQFMYVSDYSESASGITKVNN